jgi:hypothetical protein
MWEFKKLYCGFLLDILKGLVHFEGIRNRLASFWTELVPLEAAKHQEVVQNEN